MKSFLFTNHSISNFNFPKRYQNTFNKIYNFHTFPRRLNSLKKNSLHQPIKEIQTNLTSIYPPILNIRTLIDFPATYRFEHVDSTGWHFSLVFPTLPSSEKVSHGTTTRPSRDSWNIGRRLAGPRGPWSHKSWRARRNAFTQETAHAERVHASALQRLAIETREKRERERERERSTNRPIIRLDR